jgi:bud emergence protein 1
LIHPPTSATVKTQAFYAVVLHDFVPERPDELNAKAGDFISVVAQSNREWFLAKSIGRVGRPGLIPVSFVEVRDHTGKPIVDIDALMDNGTLPRVEDWKKQAFNYIANSITLGGLGD